MCPQFDSGSCHHKFEGADPAPFYFMKYILKNLCIPVLHEQQIPSAIQSFLQISFDSIQSWKIIRRALDTRKKNYPVFVYTLEIDIASSDIKHPNLNLYQKPAEDITPKTKLRDINPVIIGMGPAGLFCALAMVESGLKPILYERGDKLERRATAVNKFWEQGNLDTESNVQFGEGGAGAFSDGKLTSRSSSLASQIVYDYLINFGAEESIRWEALPHLGTETIRMVVHNIREYLIEKGCVFNYRSKFNEIMVSQNHVEKIKINADGFKPEIVILSIGNAARDTYRMLNANGIILEPKPFALGFRISHPQAWINKSVYGSEKWVDALGAASYRYTASLAGKGTYTFCMCPGGYIIAASSEEKTCVTNGMSYSKRNHNFGNSAIVSQVDATDYGSGLWDGMILQTQIEHKAFINKYAAPAQKAPDYLSSALTEHIVNTDLFPDLQSFQISELFYPQIDYALKKGLKHFDQIMPGFIRHGVIIAPETRTSSPIRIVRDKEHGNCIDIHNLYAVGEGSGYSGGIISSATDGYQLGSRFHY